MDDVLALTSSIVVSQGSENGCSTSFGKLLPQIERGRDFVTLIFSISSKEGYSVFTDFGSGMVDF